jgi:hypothetical protein
MVLLDIWDYFMIVGIIAQIIGFVILLSRSIDYVRNLLSSFDFLLRMTDLKPTDKLSDLEKLTKPMITSEMQNRILRVWESLGIRLVILGLIAQLISVIMPKILS